MFANLNNHVDGGAKLHCHLVDVGCEVGLKVLRDGTLSDQRVQCADVGRQIDVQQQLNGGFY